MAARFTEAFNKLVDKAEVPADFKEWLLFCRILDSKDYAVLASKEELIKPDILEDAKEDSDKPVPKALEIAYRKSATKLWLACRTALKAADKDSNEDDKLPMEVGTKIGSGWTERHNFE